MERTLLISIGLVIMVVFIFLRRWRAATIPAVAVPVSLIGTFGIMYLAGYSLDNLSLMALTIATGFVVDDAVVVLENVSRHIEEGITPLEAALLGAREVGFTVLSMSISLIAVFVPILLMGGIVGRLFREFAVTLSAAILVSLVVSLTTTPMMCARVLRPESEEKPGRLSRFIERMFARLLQGYDRTLRWALAHRRIMLAVAGRHRGTERLPLRHRSQGLHAAAGYRPHPGEPRGRPEHLVPGDASETHGLRRNREGRSGGRPCRGVHRRRPA